MKTTLLTLLCATSVMAGIDDGMLKEWTNGAVFSESNSIVRYNNTNIVILPFYSTNIFPLWSFTNDGPDYVNIQPGYKGKILLGDKTYIVVPVTNITHELKEVKP